MWQKFGWIAELIYFCWLKLYFFNQVRSFLILYLSVMHAQRLSVQQVISTLARKNYLVYNFDKHENTVSKAVFLHLKHRAVFLLLIFKCKVNWKLEKCFCQRLFSLTGERNGKTLPENTLLTIWRQFMARKTHPFTNLPFSG